MTIKELEVLPSSSFQISVYFQVCHIFLKEIRGPNSENPSKTTQIFKDAYKGESNKGIIGKWGFHLNDQISTNYIRQHWEREIRTFGWKYQRRCGYISGKLHRFSEMEGKICFGSLSPLSRNSNELGPRAVVGGREGDSVQVEHAHVFWYCPHIQSFWRESGTFFSLFE